MTHTKNVISLVAISCAVFFGTLAFPNSKGTTDTEIRLGTIVSSDDMAAGQGIVALIVNAYVKKINEEGGIGGRMIKIYSYDDGGDSKRTLNTVRKLVEMDHVALLFNMGRRANDVIAPYIRFKKIPTFGKPIAPQMQAEVLGNYITRHLPKATIAILSQPDYFAAQFLTGFYTGLGMEHAKSAITNADDIRPADQSVNHVARVSGGNSDILAIFGRPQADLELLQELTKLRWRPLVVMNDAAQTLALNQIHASAGIISPSNHRADGRTAAALADWNEFRKSYLSSDEPDSPITRDGYFLARSLVALLQRADGEITFERLINNYDTMRSVITTVLDVHTIDLVRFNGEKWDVIESDVQRFQRNTQN